MPNSVSDHEARNDSGSRRRELCLSLAVGALAAAGSVAVRAALRDDMPPPYIATPQQVVDRMLDMARVSKDDYVIDLGCGDGRIVISAARRFGARGLGVEIDPGLVVQARKLAQSAGVTELARFERQDALQTDLSAATLLTLYLGPELNEKLLPRILETMRPGTRVVSHDFPLGLWQPDRSERFEVPEKNFGRGGESVVMLWVVPARIHGRWRAEIGDGGQVRTEDISIAQTFQRFEGAAHRGARAQPLADTRIDGARITFAIPSPDASLGPHRIEARVERDAMQGVARVGSGQSERTLTYSARRVSNRPDLR